jgi:hypothetical protein
VPRDYFPAEPVPVLLGAPPVARRDLVDGLLRPLGAAPAAAVLDLDAPDDEVASFLARIAHAEGGFVARTGSGARAVAIVAATAAALCGEDIHTALTSPDLQFLQGLGEPAVLALRGVLLAIESSAPDVVATALDALRPASRPPDIGQTPSLPRTGR